MRNPIYLASLSVDSSFPPQLQVFLDISSILSNRGSEMEEHHLDGEDQPQIWNMWNQDLRDDFF